MERTRASFLQFIFIPPASHGKGSFARETPRLVKQEALRTLPGRREAAVNLFLWKNDEWTGPYSLEQIRELLESAAAAATDFGWARRITNPAAFGQVEPLSACRKICAK
jgi:hypothetical protein